MEKRKCPRFPVMLPTVFFGERAGGGLATDVSLEGYRIRRVVPMHKGNYVQIRVDLIGETLTGDRSSDHAHTRRCGSRLFSRSAPCP